MRLTAARCTAGDDWVVAPKWQTLAGEWMLQAAVEGYLAGGASGPGLLEEAFAYGCPGPRKDGGDEEDEGVEVLRALFCREEEPRVQIQEWRTTRRDFIDYVSFPSPWRSGLVVWLRCSVLRCLAFFFSLCEWVSELLMPRCSFCQNRARPLRSSRLWRSRAATTLSRASSGTSLAS